MDVVVPLSKGSTWNDNELRFMLRSFCKYYPQHDRIVIIGSKPDWIRNVSFIPAQDLPGIENKEFNIMSKILIACKSNVSDNFVFANDDHFLTKPIESFEYLYSVDLRESIASRKAQDHYWNSLTNTVKALTERKKATLNYDIHYPIVYNKDIFQKVMRSHNWKIPYGYVIKSLYSNTISVKGIQEIDLKINSSMDCFQLEEVIGEKSFFSIGDKAINQHLMTFLKYLYPEKSKYE